MEEQNSLGNLGRFIRKVLTNYRDEPSNLVWENIARNLDQQVQYRASQRLKKVKQIAAWILFWILLLGQHLYFHQRILALNARNQYLQDLLNSSKTKEIQPDYQLSGSIPNLPTYSSRPSHSTIPPILFPQPSNAGFLPNKPIVLSSGITQPTALFTDARVVSPHPAVATAPTLKNLHQNPVQNRLRLFHMRAAETPRSNQRMTVGFHVQPAFMKTTTVISYVPRFNNSNPTPQKRTLHGDGWVIYSGLTLEHKFGKHFSLHTGIDYQHSDVTTQHHITLRKNQNYVGWHHHHWNNSNDYNFSINTNSGPFEVQVRVSETDTLHSNNYDVEFHTSTSRKLDYLSFPILAAYTLGKGRWNFEVQGGIVANFLINNQVTYPIVSVGSPYYRINHYIAERTKRVVLSPATLDFEGTLGVSYKVSPRVQAFVMPSFLFGLTRQEQNSSIRSTYTKTGLNAGIRIRMLHE